MNTKIAGKILIFSFFCWLPTLILVLFLYSYVPKILRYFLDYSWIVPFFVIQRILSANVFWRNQLKLSIDNLYWGFAIIVALVSSHSLVILALIYTSGFFYFSISFLFIPLCILGEIKTIGSQYYDIRKTNAFCFFFPIWLTWILLFLYSNFTPRKLIDLFGKQLMILAETIWKQELPDFLFNIWYFGNWIRLWDRVLSILIGILLLEIILNFARFFLFQSKVSIPHSMPWHSFKGKFILGICAFLIIYSIFTINFEKLDNPPSSLACQNNIHVVALFLAKEKGPEDRKSFLQDSFDRAISCHDKNPNRTPLKTLKELSLLALKEGIKLEYSSGWYKDSNKKLYEFLEQAKIAQEKALP